jgi:hypothetical protein
MTVTGFGVVTTPWSVAKEKVGCQIPSILVKSLNSNCGLLFVKINALALKALLWKEHTTLFSTWHGTLW